MNNATVFVVFIVMCSNIFVDALSRLNEKCITVDECDKNAYICASNRTCQCYPGYIPNEGYNKCLGGISQKCKYDDDCIKEAFCKNQQKCECKDDLIPSEDGFVCSGASTTSTCGKLALCLLLLYFYNII